MTAAHEMLITIFAAKPSVDARVRMISTPPLRYRKAELVSIARAEGLDSSGTHSALCFRIARAL